MSVELFVLFEAWLERKPLPLINRQEGDILIILKAIFDDLERQKEIDGFFYDFYSKKHNLLIEYDEVHHGQSKKAIIKTANKKALAEKNKHVFFTIREKTSPLDIARLIKRYTLPL